MHICTDCIPRRGPSAIQAATQETDENIPDVRAALGTPLGSPNQDLRESAVMLTGKKWSTGRILRCSFDWGGDTKVTKKIREVADRWMEYANVKFEWVVGQGDVRISLDPAGGSWSYIGTDNLTIPKQEATMNFGWLAPGTSETEYHRVVLHEFGHLLGMPHEHQNPAGGIPWDRNAVYAYYGGPPNNWDKQTIDENIFAQYAETQTVHTELDRNSIMLYAIPNELTIGDWWVGWNTELSEQDKQFMSWQYPYEGTGSGAGGGGEEGGGTDELAALPRVPVSRYTSRDLSREVVVTSGGKDRVHSKPIT